MISQSKFLKDVSFLYFLAILAVAGYSVFSIAFTPGSVLITGNIHDFLIPANAAYLLDQGGNIHEDYHSPFGYLYFTLNHLSFSVIKAAEGNIAAVSLVTSIIFLAIAAIPLLLLLLSLKGARNIPFWFLGFIVLLILVPRDYSGSQHNVTWYGTYNRDMWGMIFIQLYAWLTLLVQADSKRDLTSRQLLLLALMSAICLSVTFLYKISFFAASGMMVAATSLLISGRFFKYALLTTAGFSFFAFLPTTVGYSYEGYFHDLMMAVNAKKENQATYYVSSVIVFLIACSAVVYKFRICRLTKLTITSILFTAVSIFLGIAGDFSTPYIFYFLAILLVVFSKTSDQKNYRRIIAISFVIFAMIDLLALSRIARNIGYDQTAKGSRTVPLEIHSESNPVRFLIKRERFNAGNFISWVENTQSEFFNGSALDIENYWFYRSYDNDPIQPPYDNWDYIHQVNDGIDVIKPLLDKSPQLVVTTTEFTNPFPFFLGSKVPDGSLHWIHPGTTVNRETMQSLDFAHADLILLPVFSPDFWQLDLNCSFYMFNHNRNYPYVPFKADSSWVYFIRDSLLEQHDLKQLAEFDNSKARIIKSCEVASDE